MKTFKNYHILTVKYLGATNTQGSRVKITSHRFEQSVTISYNYSLNSITDMAMEYLKENTNHEIIGKGELDSQKDILISETFEPIK